jgi:hypothetical protein
LYAINIRVAASNVDVPSSLTINTVVRGIVARRVEVLARFTSDTITLDAIATCRGPLTLGTIDAGGFRDSGSSCTVLANSTFNAVRCCVVSLRG